MSAIKIVAAIYGAFTYYVVDFIWHFTKTKMKRNQELHYEFLKL